MFVYTFHTLLTILIVHFFADFALQTHEQASMKSTNLKMLTYHVGVYSLSWLIVSWGFYRNVEYAAIFAAITFAAHWVTDYVTSRVGKPFWEKQDLHNGFVVVGFDQVLHYIQLLLTHSLIVNLNS